MVLQFHPRTAHFSSRRRSTWPMWSTQGRRVLPTHGDERPQRDAARSMVIRESDAGERSIRCCSGRRSPECCCLTPPRRLSADGQVTDHLWSAARQPRGKRQQILSDRDGHRPGHSAGRARSNFQPLFHDQGNWNQASGWPSSIALSRPMTGGFIVALN